MLKINSSSKNVELLVADSNNQNSIDLLVQKTNVILSTVGPFALYGTPIVDACVRFKTHYCDITGESPWVRNIIDQYHEEAQAKQVKIIPFSGFDSIPSDLGALLLVDHITNKLNRSVMDMKIYVGPLKAGGISGGTVASGLNIFEKGNSKKNSDPFLLSPEEKNKKRSSHQQLFIGWSKDLKKWTSPWIMSIVNTQVVRRSESLQPNLYGNDFSISEIFQWKNFFQAFIATIFFMFFTIFCSIKPFRSFFQWILPKPGQGPTKKQLEEGFFNYTIVAYTKPLGNEKSIRVMGSVKGKGDPGYLLTSKMVSETSICLALQQNQLPQRGGILTPATGLGNILIDRLHKKGISFEIIEDGITKNQN